MARLLTTANDQSITLRCLCVCDSTLVGEHFHLLKMFEHESANFSRGMFLNLGERERERERKSLKQKRKLGLRKDIWMGPSSLERILPRRVKGFSMELFS